MSIFDEVMIVVDDQTETKLDTIHKFLSDHSLQMVGSTVGRLVSRGWLEKRTQNNDDIFRLTKDGNQFMDQILGMIHQVEQPWNGQWFCVVAKLDNGKQTERVNLRRTLVGRGFGALIDGFWISPYNRQDEVNMLIKDLELGPGILIFTIDSLGLGAVQFVVKTAWDWMNLESKMAEFIKKISPQIAAIEAQAKVNQDVQARAKVRIEAKKIVFDYATIMRQGLGFPESIAPASVSRQAARDLYQRVRVLCY